MKKSTLYYIWLGAFWVCFGLSLIAAPSKPLQTVMTIFSVAFFVPPAWLMVQAKMEEDHKTVKLLRKIAILSLSVTVLMFIINIMSMAWSEAFGNFLYYALTFVSVPMVCSGHYALSLFLWACLLYGSFVKYQK